MTKEAKFILDKPKSTSETHIFLKFSCSDLPLKYSTGKKTLPNNWNFDLQRSQKDRSINRELDRLHGIVEKYVESQRKLGNRVITRSNLKTELDELNNKVERRLITDTNNFLVQIQSIIKEAEEGILLTPVKKTRYTSGTLKNLKKSLKILNEFELNLRFDQITLDTYNRFINFCNARNYSSSYIGLLIKDWKTFMAIANSRKWHNNLVYKHPDFKCPKEKSDQIYLNDEEIQLLINLDLSDNPTHSNIRDRYIINLYTGLRISDMKTLQIANIQDNLITHINKKTGKKVVIPIHQRVIAILTHYGGLLPRQYHEAVVNREIKKIAKKAGLNAKVRYSKTIGGVTKHFVKEKWELVTNHTSRRSLATNLLKHVNIQEAMPVLGMSLKTLQLYNKITAEENAINLQSNRFFKN